ncbi:prolyl 4-hydroxylase subunit alpha-1-like isoform X4 [Macrobrachium nipponense]|uniref:prolyl 4-hydroxylase subunit alpha-1-like isoform X4 n=1 Tax=Macrobrachium nipponense TaxID=159736 RepID=UPI0030C84E73
MFIFFSLLLTFKGVAVEGHGVSGELYSSLTHMTDLFVFDRKVGELLPFLPSYLPEVTSYKESYSCLIHDVVRLARGSTLKEGDFLDVAITGNPLHLFAVIKRLVLYWPPIRRSIGTIFSSNESCADKNQNCRWWAKWSECSNNPTFMMVNCQESCGFCGKPVLSVYDCIRIANESHDEGQYANAWLWYNFAGAIATSPEMKGLIAGLKGPLAREHDEDLSTIDGRCFPYPLSQYEIQEPTDSQYFSLCRGNSFLSNEAAASLKCYISSRGSPYLILRPIKVEQVLHDPEMYVFYDVISDNEVQAIKDVAREQLARSTVLSHSGAVELRVSQTAWLRNTSHPYFAAMAKRISAITGLNVFEDEGNFFAGEPLQVLSYGIGGHYIYHLDALWKYDLPENWENHREKFADFESGDRIATWMFYLSDVEAGGRTAFPKAGVSVTPVKGSAVFWFNLKRNGEVNPRSEHGGCPVLLGHKWVTNKWIREASNFMRRPCNLSEHE